MEESLRIIEHNIELTSDKASSLCEIRYAMYHEAALEIAKNGEISNTSEIVRIFEALHGKNLYEADLCDYARFSTEVTDVAGDGYGSFPVIPLISNTDACSIAYMKNSYSDAAFLKFTKNFNNTSAVYFTGFREVCEDVLTGHCTHAMIPIYSSKDGQLASFRKLISKYELKIVSECDVEMNDDSTMRFALLQRGLSLPENAKYIDLTAILPDSIPLGKFISSLEILGGEVIMANSLPLEYSDDKYSLNFIIEIGQINLPTLYLFLEGAQISYDIIGVYSLIS